MQMNLYDFYNIVKKQDIIFCYSGSIIQECLEGISQTLRKKLLADEVSLPLSQAIFTIFIEEMQNIVNYSSERQSYNYSDNSNSIELSSGIFTIGTIEKDFFINCGNQILKSDVPFLTEKIEEIRLMSKEELKSLYRERRRHPASNITSKGAGIGLIEIAKRAGKPIKYEFSDINETYSFFSIYVVVSG